MLGFICTRLALAVIPGAAAVNKVSHIDRTSGGSATARKALILAFLTSPAVAASAAAEHRPQPPISNYYRLDKSAEPSHASDKLGRLLEEAGGLPLETAWLYAGKVQTAGAEQSGVEALPDSAELRPNFHCSWSAEIPAVFTRLYPAYVVLSHSARQIPAAGSSSLAENGDGADWRAGWNFISRQPGLPSLRIEFLDDPEPNAYAVSSKQNANRQAIIYLSRGITALFRSRSDLAFVLAHEMAHLKADHHMPDFSLALLTGRQLKRISAIHQDWEFQADQAALTQMARAGFDTLAPAALLQELSRYKAAIDRGFDHRHPSTARRIRALQSGRAGLFGQSAGVDEKHSRSFQ